MFILELIFWALSAAVAFTLVLLLIQAIVGGVIVLSVKFDDWRAKRK